MFLLLDVKSEEGWIQSWAEVPIFGHAFVFTLIFIPAVICSYTAHAFIPYLYNEIGFTKAMLILLPGWNGLMWFYKIRLFIFFLPTWIVFAVISIVKIFLLLTGQGD